MSRFFGPRRGRCGRAETYETTDGRPVRSASTRNRQRHAKVKSERHAQRSASDNGAGNAPRRSAIAPSAPQIKCHIMPSHFRLISLKTNDRHPREVSHFFVACLGSPISRLAFLPGLASASSAYLDLELPATHRDSPVTNHAFLIDTEAIRI